MTHTTIHYIPVLIIAISALWIFSIIGGVIIGKWKNRLQVALPVCLFLGPLGLCITLLIPSKPALSPSAMPAKP